MEPAARQRSGAFSGSAKVFDEILHGAAGGVLGRADADETAATAMPDLNREAGQTIEFQRRALAEAVVCRQYQLQPGLRERYGEGGRAKCIQDTEYYLGVKDPH